MPIEGTLMEVIKQFNNHEGVEALEVFRSWGSSVAKEECCAHGPVFRIPATILIDTIMVMDYVLARRVLMGDEEGEKAAIMKALNMLGSNNYSAVTKMTADVHRERARKDVAKAFSSVNLKKLIPDIYGCLSHMHKVLDELVENHEIVDMNVLMNRFMLTLLMKTSMCVDVAFKEGIMADSEGKIKLSEGTAIDGILLQKLTKRCMKEKAKQILNPVREWMIWESAVIQQKKDEVTMRNQMEKLLELYKAKKEKEKTDTSGSTREEDTSILSFLCSTSYEKEIDCLSDIISFIIAGHETSATSLCYLLLELMRHPDKEALLLAELDTVMPKDFSVDHATDASLQNKIANLPYLNCCIKETMRLWPVPAGGPARDLTQDIEYDGYVLKKGSTVVVHFYSMFRQPWIHNADEFVPERWYETNPQLPQLKEMFMPFSLGRRNCSGQNLANLQLRVVAANLLAYFDFNLSDKPEHKVKYSYFLLLHLQSLHVCVRKREREV